jgi:hypothetical protein
LSGFAGEHPYLVAKDKDLDLALTSAGPSDDVSMSAYGQDSRLHNGDLRTDGGLTRRRQRS